MDNVIDYYDVQGNIMINYAEFGYIKSRYVFIKITIGEDGRKFIKEIAPLITSSALMQNGTISLPEVTTNVSFTYNGLKILGVPILSLHAFPDEYVMGIRNRTSILGDNSASGPEHWDDVYRDDIHMFMSMDAKDDESLVKRYESIASIVDQIDGVELIQGCNNGRKELDKFQEASVLYDENGFPTAKEHFGYTDGISNPFFKGMTPEMGEVIGGGKKLNYNNPMVEENWGPIETGEFILGYRDEANEYPAAPIPKLLSKNGSFMVFNKFHENVGKFNEYLDTASEKYNIDKEELAAKFVGRWRNGAPMTTFPTQKAADEIADERQKAIFALNTAKTPEELAKAHEKFKEVNRHFIGFDFFDDIPGSRCPVGSHIRRANPRGALEFNSKDAFSTPAALDNRRRMIRRGLPYGIATMESNEGEHGTIIMTIVANIKRQFEFVVQQWLNYGNDFKLANDKDPITGNQDEDGGRLIIEGDEKQLPKYLAGIPRFIETRGGVYLFIPSLTAIKYISEGIVDPT
ncbi:MAG: hypothetical protein R8G66_02460 [Cytophagales bacterium]|nr:hypothetical protein [Cytophagales bacterium]